MSNIGIKIARAHHGDVRLDAKVRCSGPTRKFSYWVISQRVNAFLRPKATISNQIMKKIFLRMHFESKDEDSAEKRFNLVDNCISKSGENKYVGRNIKRLKNEAQSITYLSTEILAATDCRGLR